MLQLIFLAIFFDKVDFPTSPLPTMYKNCLSLILWSNYLTNVSIFIMHLQFLILNYNI